MRIYFSGGNGTTNTPEGLIPELKPHIMPTFHNLYPKEEKSTTMRVEVYTKRIKNESKKRNAP